MTIVEPVAFIYAALSYLLLLLSRGFFRLYLDGQLCYTTDPRHVVHGVSIRRRRTRNEGREEGKIGARGRFFYIVERFHRQNRLLSSTMMHTTFRIVLAALRRNASSQLQVDSLTLHEETPVSTRFHKLVREYH